MKVTVRYFAALREQRGIGSETLDTVAATPAQLYAEIHRNHGLTLKESQVRFAVNGGYVAEDHALNDGDEIVFIPPVAGG